jgi:hypothetical protein
VRGWGVGKNFKNPFKKIHKIVVSKNIKKKNKKKRKRLEKKKN